MERRKHARHPARRPAKASFGGQGAMPCWIRDMSPDGARIEISGAGWISYAFNLRDVMSGAWRKCAVVWRNNALIGVQFADRNDWPKPELPRRHAGASFGRRKNADNDT
ncbi:MAG TPA: PilZ domain-containing protein [Hyphomicrobium sp.]|nr:PilZ domain-containing protein [Hyphomicrobium sp.]